MVRRNRSVIVGVGLVILGALAAPVATAKTFVIPHILETSGKITASQAAEAGLLPAGQDITGKNGQAEFNFDTQFVLVNSSGIGGVPVPGSGVAVVTIYLFDDATGRPMQGATGPVCPTGCTFTLQPGAKLKKTVEQLANENAGGLGGFGVKTGYGIVVVGGDAADVVIPLSFVVNAQTGASNLSVMGFSPVELGTP